MNTLENILKELISARVEQLAHEAEQHPDFVMSREQMLPLRTKAEQLMGEDGTEEQAIVQNNKMSSTHLGPRTFCYPSNPSSSQERVNPNSFFKKKKFGLYWFGGGYLNAYNAKQCLTGRVHLRMI